MALLTPEVAQRVYMKFGITILVFFVNYNSKLHLFSKTVTYGVKMQLKNGTRGGAPSGVSQLQRGAQTAYMLTT